MDTELAMLTDWKSGAVGETKKRLIFLRFVAVNAIDDSEEIFGR